VLRQRPVRSGPALVAGSHLREARREFTALDVQRYVARADALGVGL
jgi:hypothetical protein